MDLKNLKKKFKTIYGYDDNVLFYFSPSRINLIGEHVDYNGGSVLPCALNIGTYGVIKKREDFIFNFASLNFDLKVSCDINNLDFKKEDDWANYLKGIIKEFLNLNKMLSGLDILIYGDIPNGSGLSSSASIELLMSFILNDMFDCGQKTLDIVKMSQKVENEYIGVNCGIMDQFAIGMGKKDCAILLNCNTLDYEYIKLHLKNHKIIIANTNKPRKLTDSKYNERRSECEQAVNALNKNFNIKFLSEISRKDFDENKNLILSDILIKRASHVVYEVERTKNAVMALKNNNLAMFGKLMIESHNSLKNLYEVTGIELDTLVDEALKIKGTLGSRMTGAGFGGCTISIIEDDYVDEFIKKVGFEYFKKIGLKADFYIPKISDRVRKL